MKFKVENVSDRACLLIAQLSSKDNLIDEDYVRGKNYIELDENLLFTNIN
jgi:hypothetical protein